MPGVVIVVGLATGRPFGFGVAIGADRFHGVASVAPAGCFHVRRAIHEHCRRGIFRSGGHLHSQAFDRPTASVAYGRDQDSEDHACRQGASPQ